MNTPQLLLVDDDPGMIQVMARALAGLGRLRFATSGEQALAQMQSLAPDVVLLDADMPGLDGFQVCERMQADPALAEIPVIFVTGHDSPEVELRGLEIGAADFIAKPIREPLLVARVRTQLRVKALTDELRQVAATDALTGVANRRSFDEALRREWRRARRAGESLSLLMIDVDYFKAYNDHYGHPLGDACLRQVAQQIGAALLRPSDLPARYGGEEFAVLLPDTDRLGACRVARRLLALLRRQALPHAGSAVAPYVTASVGIASYDEHSPAWQPACGDSTRGELPLGPGDLVRAADAALYAAKRGGRNAAWLLDIDDAATPALAQPCAAEPLLDVAQDAR